MAIMADHVVELMLAWMDRQLDGRGENIIVGA